MQDRSIFILTKFERANFQSKIEFTQNLNAVEVVVWKGCSQINYENFTMNEKKCSVIEPFLTDI